MDTSKHDENPNLDYIKKIVSEVMGEGLWNGFYDVVTAERPRIDMYDNGKKIIVVCEIPGILKPSDLSISVSLNKLNIRGISKDKYLNNLPGNMLKSECIYGPFDRTVELPYIVNEKSINAVYENGIIEITMERADTGDEQHVRVDFKK
ncbi:Hsp20/alpha crystallin family protein [Oxobacter pfennigii]|uniref:Hsp20/alpha crystallin family protein n=1 Tax=Oxobacter pfennigii TaxID=36849 RepID=A0A0P8YGY2_9CLOT|nr:Hsp20/alpha crystallin family protein [Oxobacter pfennigii]KPU46342.1 Hsp20/alpha crystallin family protein [Oxobacter pfennigii]